LGDLDGDGDLDAFIAHGETGQENGGELPNKVWLNETITAVIAPPTTKTLGDTWTRPADGAAMLYVPAGAFQMGSAEGDPLANEGEFPQHTVTLDSFWIDQTEVTNAQYALCAEAGNCRASKYSQNAAYNGDDYPTVGISWQDAADYCAWAGGRLPTEAEWEYAAKGVEGHRYPWGDEFDSSRVNYCDVNCESAWADAAVDDGYAENAPVGSYPAGASWAGALDMAGNVWEWAADWYGDYTAEAQVNPAGPEVGNYKIIRGGCWTNAQDGVRTAYRFDGGGEILLSFRHSNIGFRCVLSGPSAAQTMVGVPQGSSPTLDGTLSPGEWNNATVETFADGSELLLMHAGGYLYLGIRANTTEMIVGNVFIQRGDEITIFHSSEALGTAIYQKGEDHWHQVQDFTWQCRDASDSDIAQAERDAFLQQEGWVAANSRMGTPEELEYRIEIAEDALRLAVNFIRGSNPNEKIPWPAGLDDDCIKPTPGGLPPEMQFSPELWGVNK
jgi:formylglycine-generating enzyme required for sulfatase activity